jgi:hypothetical protein
MTSDVHRRLIAAVSKPGAVALIEIQQKPTARPHDDAGSADPDAFAEAVRRWRAGHDPIQTEGASAPPSSSTLPAKMLSEAEAAKARARLRAAVLDEGAPCEVPAGAHARLIAAFTR